MGAPPFVDFGKNMEHSPDGKAYLLGMGAVEEDPKPWPCIKPTADGGFEVQPCEDDFDRPNPLDQATGGRLEFSDGSSIDLAQPLPDRATQGLELVFEPKTVSRVKFTVTAVKPDSPNIGLAEFGAFRLVDSPPKGN